MATHLHLAHPVVRHILLNKHRTAHHHSMATHLPMAPPVDRHILHTNREATLHQEALRLASMAHRPASMVSSRGMANSKATVNRLLLITATMAVLPLPARLADHRWADMVGHLQWAADTLHNRLPATSPARRRQWTARAKLTRLELP